MADIKTIPLDKVEKFKKEVENKYDDFANSWDERAEGKNEMINEVLEMLDKLIESSTPLNKALADIEKEQEPKAGCEGCIYEKTGNNSTYPCSHCGRCYTDKYKAESEKK